MYVPLAVWRCGLPAVPTSCLPILLDYANRRRCRVFLRTRYDGVVQELHRITMDPEVMGGKPCVRGMRVTVGMIVESLAAGRTIEDLLTDFPYLQEPDIREALAFAACLAQGHEIRLAS